MSNIHESVGYCKRCDHYIARDLIERCQECHKHFCTDCGIATNDPDLSCCSRECAEAFNRRIRQELEKQRREYGARPLDYVIADGTHCDWSAA